MWEKKQAVKNKNKNKSLWASQTIVMDIFGVVDLNTKNDFSKGEEKKKKKQSSS